MKQKRIISDLSGDTGRVIDAREIGGNGSVTVDSALSKTSTNPVQNKKVTVAILQLQDLANMLGDTIGELNQIKQDIPTSVTVSGSTPTITPQDGYIYNCGELTSLTISNPPATGKYSIIFFSGATATTVVGIENFAAEANKRYKITVEDNYATYDSWPYTPT